MSKPFASAADLAERRLTFVRLAAGVYACTADGDPNAGVIIGDDGVLVVDARATPALGRELLAGIRAITDKPIRFLVLTHYHAVRVLGAQALAPGHIIASAGTAALIAERGRQDFRSEVARFPRLFRAVDEVPGLTRPDIVFDRRLVLRLGRREIEVLHPGRGHTGGDTVVWLPRERVLFAGDLVEDGASPYCGDAYIGAWIGTLGRLAALEPRRLVPGRGAALRSPERAAAAIRSTRRFLRALLGTVRREARAGASLGETFAAVRRRLDPVYGDWVIYEHCLPFNVARAYDEVRGIRDPRVWTARRDRELWRALQG